MAARVLIAAALLAVIARIGGRTVLSRAVERRLNRTLVRSPYSASPAAARLHRELVVADLHADSLLWGRDLLRRSTTGHLDVPRLIEGNVALQALSACVRVPLGLNVERNDGRTDAVILLALAQGWPRATWHSGLARALHLAARARGMADRSAGLLTVVDSAAVLAGYLERRRSDPAMTACLLTIEGGSALDGDPRNVDVLADAGFRMVGPVHMFDNPFAGSVSGVGEGGLTRLGRELVTRLEARRIVVDVAHASAATIDDVLAMATRPVVASHTGLRGTCDTVRNLSDDQVRGVAATGGIVGVGFWPTVTCGRDPAAIARSVVHAVDVAGIDHVGLGSDFDGAVPVPFDATGLVQLTDALLSVGLDSPAIGAIMGGNVIRLLREALPR